jgi:hypothetical protein
VLLEEAELTYEEEMEAAMGSAEDQPPQVCICVCSDSPC